MDWLHRFIRWFFTRPQPKAVPGSAHYFYEQTSGIVQQEQMEVARSWGAAVASGRADLAAAQYALTQIRIAQKQLRLVKQDIRNTMKTLRSKGVSARMNRKLDPFAGFVPGGAGIARSQRALQREQMRQKERQVLVQYESVIATIDQTLIQFEREKAQIEAWLARNRHRP